MINVYKIKIKLKTDEMMDNLKQELEMCMNDFILDIKNDATTKAYEDEPSELSDRTGQLGNTMIAKSEWQDTKLVGKITTHVEYAEYVEHGTGIYADEHRGARTRYKGYIPSLKDKTYVDVKGKERTYTGWVWINGQKPKHFMLNTCKEYRPKVKQYFRIGG